jgi:phage shock protein E
MNNRAKYRRSCFATLLLCFSGLLLSFSGNIMAEPQSFSINEAQEAIQEGALLIDVRQPDEYEEGHAPGAQNVPHDELINQLEKLGKDKNKSIVVYCRSGARSSYAKDILEQNGFTHVLNAGGLPEICSIVEGWNTP